MGEEIFLFTEELFHTYTMLLSTLIGLGNDDLVTRTTRRGTGPYHPTVVNSTQEINVEGGTD